MLLSSSGSHGAEQGKELRQWACPCRPALVKGFMQLYSVEQKRSQALEAHAAAFSTIKVPNAAFAPSWLACAPNLCGNMPPAVP